MSLVPQPAVGADVESALLGILISAESTRDGAAALLAELAPVLDQLPRALAVRDRDGLTIHILADSGALHDWPTKLEPQFAMGSNPGVDPSTGAFVVPLRASGRVVGALLLGDAPRATNVVGRPRLQAVLPTAAAVLHTLVSRTDAELRRRANALRSLDSIIDGMAHQIANPLTGASAIAQLLVEELQDEGQRAAVKQMRQELSRAFTVLSDLLDFQRDTRAQDGILDLGSLVEKVVRFRGYAIREQGIALDLDLSSVYLPVRADARGLEHALLIALRHAELRSHGTVNRRVSVRLAEMPDSQLVVQITDSGTGDVPDLSPSYFDIPYRLEHLARASSPDEMDLGLVDSLLRGCGGRLDVQGSKADGTTLALVLPKAYTNPTATRKTA
ncbi:MAG: sensor histidine kinase [Gemmatimonadaceae bacterium]